MAFPRPPPISRPGPPQTDVPLSPVFFACVNTTLCCSLVLSFVGFRTMKNRATGSPSYCYLVPWVDWYVAPPRCPEHLDVVAFFVIRGRPSPFSWVGCGRRQYSTSMYPSHAGTDWESPTCYRVPDEGVEEKSCSPDLQFPMVHHQLRDEGWGEPDAADAAAVPPQKDRGHELPRWAKNPICRATSFWGGFPRSLAPGYRLFLYEAPIDNNRALILRIHG